MELKLLFILPLNIAPCEEQVAWKHKNQHQPWQSRMKRSGTDLFDFVRSVITRKKYWRLFTV